MEFFQGCGIGETCQVGEAITRFKASGLMMKLARTATGGILIKALFFIQQPVS
jgi:hypothetical protein